MFTVINSLSESERWFYGLLALATTTWSGHWFAQRLNHGLSRSRNQEERFIDAKKAFRDLLNEVILTIDPEEDKRKLLTHVAKSRPKLDIAVAELRNHFHWLSRIRFNRLWKKYNYVCHRQPYSKGELKQAIHALLRFST